MAQDPNTKPKTPDVEKKEAVAYIRNFKDHVASDLTLGELARAMKGIRRAGRVALPEKEKKERNEQHLACLKKSLQAAVTLEFATVPPYLCALWSIKDELHPVAKSIREVVQEEMLHMALACNMLTSLGETPQINTVVPRYPGGFPGGVHEGLVVHLSGLTKKALSDFLWIERPLEEVPVEHPYSDDPADGNEPFRDGKLRHPEAPDETIGEFYQQIFKAFDAYLADEDNPRLSPDNQITGPLAYAVIRDMDNVEYAIKLILDQGEGSENNPEEAEGQLSHYYRFLEVYDEVNYTWNAEDKILERGDPLVFPDVWPMAPVPEGGYKQEDVSEEVWYHLDEFDKTYSKLLDQLQAAWTRGGQASMVHAYETMFDLEKHAKPLMRTPMPAGGDRTYGPCFRYRLPTSAPGL